MMKTVRIKRSPWLIELIIKLVLKHKLINKHLPTGYYVYIRKYFRYLLLVLVFLLLVSLKFVISSTLVLVFISLTKMFYFSFLPLLIFVFVN